MTSEPQLSHTLAQRLAALAQTGLTYCQDPYERERHLELQRIAADLLSGGLTLESVGLADLLASQPGYATPKVDVRGVCSATGACCWCRSGTRSLDLGALAYFYTVRPRVLDAGPGEP